MSPRFQMSAMNFLTRLRVSAHRLLSAAGGDCGCAVVVLLLCGDDDGEEFNMEGTGGGGGGTRTVVVVTRGGTGGRGLPVVLESLVLTVASCRAELASLEASEVEK